MTVPQTIEGRLQYGVLITLLGAIIMAAIAWGSTQFQVQDTTTRVNNLEMHERENTQRLTRIEDGVQAIKERLGK